jgi:hypothetical protein
MARRLSSRIQPPEIRSQPWSTRKRPTGSAQARELINGPTTESEHAREWALSGGKSGARIRKETTTTGKGERQPAKQANNGDGWRASEHVLLLCGVRVLRLRLLRFRRRRRRLRAGICEQRQTTWAGEEINQHQRVEIEEKSAVDPRGRGGGRANERTSGSPLALPLASAPPPALPFSSSLGFFSAGSAVGGGGDAGGGEPAAEGGGEGGGGGRFWAGIWAAAAEQAASSGSRGEAARWGGRGRGAGRGGRC